MQLENCEVWSWRTADLLIIDDVNAGDPLMFNFIGPSQFLTVIDTLVDDGDPAQNRTELKNKNVIWVLGSVSKFNDPVEWKRMLMTIGVPGDKIHTINLR